MPHFIIASCMAIGYLAIGGLRWAGDLACASFSGGGGGNGRRKDIGA